MSMQGRKNRQKREKNSALRCMSYGASTLAFLIANTLGKHRAMKKKKHYSTSILKD